MFGPIAFGRNNTQHFKFSGDGSGNYLAGISPGGAAKPTYIDSDASSDALRLRTRAAFPVEFYTNDIARVRVAADGTSMMPITDNATSSGGASNRWLAVYGAAGFFGPTRAGRNSTQHFFLDGDGSGNYLIGVSVSGQAKSTYIDSDANSFGIRLRTRAAQPIEFYINDTARMRMESSGATFIPVTDNAVSLGKSGNTWSALHLASAITAPGTTGNQTINKPTGRVNIAAAGTSITVTNNLVSENSRVFAEVATADATARITSVVKSSGSFVINTVAVTAETAFDFLVIP
jgi:hypothetical protein